MKKLLSLVDGKLLRFLIVGVINTLVGMAIMFGLYNLSSTSTSRSATMSRAGDRCSASS